MKSIGIGGTERWQVFPMILWLAFFGGHLLAPEHRTQLAGPGPAGKTDQRTRELTNVRWFHALSRQQVTLRRTAQVLVAVGAEGAG